MAKRKAIDLNDPITQRALHLLAAQYPPSDAAHEEIKAGEFSWHHIDPQDAVAALISVLREQAEQQPYGWLISGHAGGTMFCPASHRHVMEANATDLSKEIGITITEVYARPTGQDVDLGLVVASLRKAEALLAKSNKLNRDVVLGHAIKPFVPMLIGRDVKP